MPGAGIPSENNVGRRDMIKHELICHYSRLNAIAQSTHKKVAEQKAKPKRPNTSVANKRSKTGKLFDGYEEPRLIQKKLQEGIKGSVDHKKPDTFALVKKLKKNKKPNTYQEEMHLKNLEAMNRRIKAIGTFNERKKNVHDPLVNPSKFFRTTGDEKGVSIQKLSQKLKKQGESNAKVTDMYGKEIDTKKKQIDAKYKAALKPRKSEPSEDLFAQEEEIKGTQALPAGAKDADAEFSKEEQEMYDMMKDSNGDQYDVVSNVGEKFDIDHDKNKIPIIKFKKTLEGGWPEKFKIIQNFV